jgi:predicted RNase H-like HicB family nuclease
VSAKTCSIVVERLADGRYRASSHLLPDYEAVAATEEAARQMVERAIEQHLRQRSGQAEQSGPWPAL